MKSPRLPVQMTLMWETYLAPIFSLAGNDMQLSKSYLRLCLPDLKPISLLQAISNR